MIASAKQQPEGRVREIVVTAPPVQSSHASFAILVREPRVPAQPKVERQARVDAPIVLNEGAPLDARKIQVKSAGLSELDTWPSMKSAMLFPERLLVK